MRRGCMYRFVTTIAAAGLLCAAPLFAQSQTATLKLTVVDPTGAVLPNAAVTVSGSYEANRAAKKEAHTDAEGIATVAQLTAGRYVIEASFPGFETRSLTN